MRDLIAAAAYAGVVAVALAAGPPLDSLTECVDLLRRAVPTTTVPCTDRWHPITQEDCREYPV